MRISARNQLKGTIVEVEEGAVNGIVTIEIPCGCKIKASITNAAIHDLGLEVGKEAIAIVKVSSVMFATDRIPNISARNQLKGKLVEVEEGAVNAIRSKVRLPIRQSTSWDSRTAEMPSLYSRPAKSWSGSNKEKVSYYSLHRIKRGYTIIPDGEQLLFFLLSLVRMRPNFPGRIRIYAGFLRAQLDFLPSWS